MLITIVFIFLTCNAPALIVNAMEWFLDSSSETQTGLQSAYYLLVDIVNLMVVINSSINIIVYMWFSKQYRSLLRNCFSSKSSMSEGTHIKESQLTRRSYDSSPRQQLCLSYSDNPFRSSTTTSELVVNYNNDNISRNSSDRKKKLTFAKDSNRPLFAKNYS